MVSRAHIVPVDCLSFLGPELERRVEHEGELMMPSLVTTVILPLSHREHPSQLGSLVCFRGTPSNFSSFSASISSCVFSFTVHGQFLLQTLNFVTRGIDCITAAMLRQLPMSGLQMFPLLLKNWRLDDRPEIRQLDDDFLPMLIWHVEVGEVVLRLRLERILARSFGIEVVGCQMAVSQRYAPRLLDQAGSDARGDSSSYSETCSSYMLSYYGGWHFHRSIAVNSRISCSDHAFF